jgi:hypothetical protein
MAGSDLGAVVVVGETEPVQAARAKARTTITPAPSLRIMLVLLPAARGCQEPPFDGSRVVF